MRVDKFAWFANHEIKNKLIKRSKIIRLIREFFYDQNFIEVETPTLLPAPGMEPNLDPFETELIDCHKNKKQVYLSTSPEYAMKELLVGGMKNIFQMTKSFRNYEEINKLHNPEFTILEWYRADGNYEDIMEDVQNLFLYVCQKLNNCDYIVYQGKKISLQKPWLKFSIKELFEKYSTISLNQVKSIDDLKKIAEQKGYCVDSQDSWETTFWQIFLNEIENNLPQDKPVIIYDFPKELASLSKICENDKNFAQRFEFYIAGLELGNAFTELNDAKEQEQRFKKEQELKAKWGKKVYEYDNDFIDSMALGMPNAGGIAIGVDRMAMLFTDAKSLQEVIWFPADKFLK